MGSAHRRCGPDPSGFLESVADPGCAPRLPDNLEIGLAPTERLVVYCNTDGRGALAAYSLKTTGYVRVADRDGGLPAWREAGLPVAGHHAQP